MSFDTTHGGPLAPGSRVAGHRVERVLRQRATGFVYLATPPPGAVVPRPGQVVLTVVDRNTSADPRALAWFARANESASGMRHPAIARVVGHGLSDGHAWAATAPVPAADAAQLLQRHPDGIDVDLAVRLVRVVGDALDAAHRKRLVHGAVSPADILFAVTEPTQIDAAQPGVVTLTGFGLARLSATETSPHPSSDVASLGRTLAELLTGTTSVARHRVSGAVSPAFYAVLARALDPGPDQHYRTCAEFIRAADLALHLTRTDGEPPTEVIGAAPPADADPNPADATDVLAGRSPGAGTPRLFHPGGHPDRPTEIVTDRRAVEFGPGESGPGESAAPAPGPAGHGAQSSSPPHHRSPPAPRRRFLAPMLVVLVVVAVVVGTLIVLGTRNTPPPWPPAVSPIADAFPQLLPATPESRAWRDASCQNVSRDGIDGITCTDPAQVTFAVWHTPTPESRRAVTATLKGHPGNKIRWRDGPASASRDSVVDGWVVTNFTGPPQADHTVITTWPGHTGRQILDDWWRSAPLG
ncbi:serine/threonine protein kinase [Gordonia sp. zg691]|uniref:serine/threonine protein kinase n=1 Tax=Gordonia jinghuaiqii TaxID=2758710 RepID=UPI0016628686|nr:serine/threonine protein kinase [Gordonia jinghuaiqii]MBD0862199.1 serine/threonine protein kinase [Gordonia jinghuaiqii]